MIDIQFFPFEKITIYNHHIITKIYPILKSCFHLKRSNEHPLSLQISRIRVRKGQMNILCLYPSTSCARL